MKINHPNLLIILLIDIAIISFFWNSPLLGFVVGAYTLLTFVFIIAVVIEDDKPNEVKR